ncbi:hypothetical protein C1J03_19150 [Sulfitobacter sp. SK012]|nr:hypothetical protein C1J03_19150 [Sulfitobacter sp. SK012]
MQQDHLPRRSTESSNRPVFWHIRPFMHKHQAEMDLLPVPTLPGSGSSQPVGKGSSERRSKRAACMLEKADLSL